MEELKKVVLEYLKSQIPKYPSDKKVRIEAGGKSYTYTDLAREVEEDTEFGKEFVVDAYKLAIHIFTRNKNKEDEKT